MKPLCIAASNPTVWAVIASLTSALNAVGHTGPLFTHFVRSVSELCLNAAITFGHSSTAISSRFAQIGLDTFFAWEDLAQNGWECLGIMLRGWPGVSRCLSEHLYLVQQVASVGVGTCQMQQVIDECAF